MKHQETEKGYIFVKIINLIENTEGAAGCASAHGLSFYIETSRHKLLLDLGPSEQTLDNSLKLGVDLAAVDAVVLSHGHYDHSGGIIPFTRLNSTAPIYMQQTAAADYYSDDGLQDSVTDPGSGESSQSSPAGSGSEKRCRYIGIDKNIASLPQVRLIEGDYRIDEELELFTVRHRSHPLPSANRRLMVRKGQEYVRDNFDHEQSLVINSDGVRVLMSGCAHNGILSILDAYREKYSSFPDVVISGFHLMKKSDYSDNEIREIKDIAGELKKYPSRFITCHCTGVPAYLIMKEIMGSQLEYVHSGEEISI